MRFDEWEPTYEQVLADMGYDRADDETSARVLRMATLGSDLVDDDVLRRIVGREATVLGDAPCLVDDITRIGRIGAVICCGSAVGRAAAAGVAPDVVVTDLDGDIGPQILACNAGAVAVIHAHGDNPPLIARYASEFKGPVMLTSQSAPVGGVSNYGGFTDGDRAVCLARHFGARRIRLLGFDLANPMAKEGSDPGTKLKKLVWAERIISIGGLDDIDLLSSDYVVDNIILRRDVSPKKSQ
ncbi:MAG: DUF115 domain-containing protein [Candidatus Methanoplasma sp.]|jgi:uncharacterized Rossmann fold enzyme|nr:DUF115 domain-containing protein [Candidatus Methanoplasma sp.]